MTDPSTSRRWPYAVYALLSAYFCAPLFVRPNGLGINDWDQHLFYYGSVVKSVLEYGQLPFWNPWYCGGNVLWQNPQIPLLSPALPLSGVVSLALAMKINILLHYFVGLVGMHVLLTAGLGVSFAPAVMFLSAVGALGGAMALHLAVGHSVFLPCLYLPLQLYFCLRSIKTGAVRDIAAGGILMALMIYNGALHVVPMSIAGLGVLGVFATIGTRRWRPVIVTALIVVAGFAYAAPKLLPVTLWVRSSSFTDVRTVIEHPDRMSVEMIAHAYLDRFQNTGLRFELQRSRWHEYGNYIGAVATLLILASVIWALAIRKTPERWLGASLALTSALLLALSAGEFSAWAPASMVGHVPLFSSFRIPSRYTIAFVLFGLATVGWVVHVLEHDTPWSPRVSAFVGIVCALAAADVVLQNRGLLERVFSLPPMEQRLAVAKGVTALSVDATSSAYTNDSPMFHALMTNRAFFNCYESLQTRRVALADRPLVESDGKSTVSDVRFSPNRVEFAVIGGRESSRVFLNQNYTPGWGSRIGPVVPAPEDGRPSVILQPGQTGKFAFTFLPPGLLAGLAILLIAVGITAATWRRRLPFRG